MMYKIYISHLLMITKTTTFKLLLFLHFAFLLLYVEFTKFKLYVHSFHIIPDKQSRGCNVNNGNCEYECIDVADGHLCQCKKGYTVQPGDKTSCIDVNECATFGHNCSQLCVNIKGSYGCECRLGFVDVTNVGRKGITSTI